MIRYIVQNLETGKFLLLCDSRAFKPNEIVKAKGCLYKVVAYVTETEENYA